jgi:hypothetical protein
MHYSREDVFQCPDLADSMNDHGPDAGANLIQSSFWLTLEPSPDSPDYTISKDQDSQET